MKYRLRRSLLFLPAVRSDRFEKALATGADVICLDLEDGVAPGAKDEAREKAFDLLRGVDRGRTELILRINDSKTERGSQDLLALCELGVAPDALMLPKIVSSEEIRQIESILHSSHPNLPLIPMIETVRGLASAEAISTVSQRIAFVFLGGVDLSVELGCDYGWEALLYARSRVVHAGSLAGVGVMDTPYMDVRDLEGLARETRAVRRLGFMGKAAIHPNQVPIIQNSISPSDKEVEWARRIIESYTQNEGGVLLVDGKLIDRPVIEKAKKILTLSEAVSMASQSASRLA